MDIYVVQDCFEREIKNKNIGDHQFMLAGYAHICARLTER